MFWLTRIQDYFINNKTQTPGHLIEGQRDYLHSLCHAHYFMRHISLYSCCLFNISYLQTLIVAQSLASPAISQVGVEHNK